MSENVKRNEDFNQVCVWPSVVLGESPVSEFEKFFKDELNVRIQFLEEIKTLPSKDENGQDIPDTGGRSDIVMAVHKDDVLRFALPRLQMGIRWIEDAVSAINNPNGIIYPERVLEYKTWDADESFEEQEEQEG